jgi:hypothetical protein
MSLARKRICITLLFCLHHLTDLDSLSRSGFNTLHHNTRWCNPSTFLFLSIYEKHFMHVIISMASFVSLIKVNKMLQSWHSHSLVILCHAFHTSTVMDQPKSQDCKWNKIYAKESSIEKGPSKQKYEIAKPKWKYENIETSLRWVYLADVWSTSRRGCSTFWMAILYLLW